MQLGARCDLCPLGQQTTDPVPAEAPMGGKKPRLVIVAESPGKTEEALGRPLCGASGAILDDALANLEIPRSECHLTNTIKCRPHRKLTGKEWKLARECCKPLLRAELSGCTRVVAMGAHAVGELAGTDKVTAWRGHPVGGKGDYAHLTVFPMQHPAFLFRSPAYVPVWVADFERAGAFSDGNLPEWKWPREIINDEAAALEFLNGLLANPEPIGLDVETAGVDPFTDALTAVAFATATVSVSLTWPCASTAVAAACSAVIKSPSIPKVLQNGNFDRIALEQHGLPLRGYDFDTLAAGVVIAPQVAHDLGGQASYEFSAPRWKSEFRVFDDRKGADRWVDVDHDALGRYNARDAYMTRILADRQRASLKRTHRGEERMAQMMRLVDLSHRMKVRGVQVDPITREQHRARLTKEQGEALAKFQEVTNGAVTNWQSVPQLHRLFYDQLGCTPTQFDKESGRPKLDAAALGDIAAAHPGEPGGLAALALHRLREKSKLLSTYVVDLPVAKWDGAVHPWWKFYTVTGRWNSDSPNMQNVPKPLKKVGPDGKESFRAGLRDMFVARPGMWLVEADYSQLELRILALLSGDKALLEAYAKGWDVHDLNAEALFSVAKKDTPKDVFKNYRDFSKRFVYGLNYGAADGTIHKSLVVTYPNTTLEGIAEMRSRWEAAHPDLAAWQKEQVQNGRDRRYVEAPLSGRRYYFYLGRVEPSICFNYPMQSTGADIINGATFALDGDLDRRRGEHIILQVHDALVCEGPDPERLGELMRKHMSVEVTLNGATARFPVDVSIGKNWGAMKPWGH